VGSFPNPLASHFGNVVDEYEDGRPDFPPATVGALAAELGLAPGARVLDLAAGTGKLTRALVAAGLDVVAVEPGPEMRERLAAGIGAERVLDGFAEEIPLPDRSVDAVTVADAWHWFDQERALADIHRVLRREPGSGGLAVCFVGQDWREAAWAEELAELVTDLRPEHPLFDGPPWQEVVNSSPDWGPLREISVRVPAPASREQILAYVSSFSFMAMKTPEERAEAAARADAIIGDREVPAELPVRFRIALARPAAEG
jgi:SAM-dependent methyltransferase